ncbi:GAF domain-containing protein [Deinococcus malanensis]|uniref:GAF domain-containing protein n=1 Tax=Deinococcus malanensis TaxID=1706855 RepID=UPI003634B047
MTLADAQMYEQKEHQREGQDLSADTRNPTSEDFAARLEGFVTPEQVVTKGLMLVRQLTGFDSGTYFAAQDGMLTESHTNADLPDLSVLRATTLDTPENVGFVGHAARRGTAWSNDYPAEPYAMAEWVQAGMKSCLAVAVRHQGHLLGVLGLAHFTGWRVVTPRARRLLEGLALRLAHVHEQTQAASRAAQALEGGLLAVGLGLEARGLEALATPCGWSGSPSSWASNWASPLNTCRRCVREPTCMTSAKARSRMISC